MQKHAFFAAASLALASSSVAFAQEPPPPPPPPAAQPSEAAPPLPGKSPITRESPTVAPASDPTHASAATQPGLSVSEPPRAAPQQYPSLGGHLGMAAPRLPSVVAEEERHVELEEVDRALGHLDREDEDRDDTAVRRRANLGCDAKAGREAVELPHDARVDDEGRPRPAVSGVESVERDELEIDRPLVVEVNRHARREAERDEVLADRGGVTAADREFSGTVLLQTGFGF